MEAASICVLKLMDSIGMNVESLLPRLEIMVKLPGKLIFVNQNHEAKKNDAKQCLVNTYS